MDALDGREKVCRGTAIPQKSGVRFEFLRSTQPRPRYQTRAPLQRRNSTLTLRSIDRPMLALDCRLGRTTPSLSELQVGIGFVGRPKIGVRVNLIRFSLPSQRERGGGETGIPSRMRRACKPPRALQGRERRLLFR